MNLTYEQRKRVRAWLDKDPKSEDKNKTLDLDGVKLTRTTEYLNDSEGKQAWKVRIGYVVETGFPVAMSSPIKAGQDHKKQYVKGESGKPYEMIPVFIDDPAPVPTKPAKPDAFAKAVEAEMDKLNAKMQYELMYGKPLIGYSSEPKPSYSWLEPVTHPEINEDEPF